MTSWHASSPCRPLPLSIRAFLWDAEPAGRGRNVGNWLHRHYAPGKRDVYARLYHRHVLFGDLGEEAWRLVGRTRSMRPAVQRAEVVKDGHLDEPALLATVNTTLWDAAQCCARLTSVHRARERAGTYDAGGLLPAQTVQHTGKVLADARAALDNPMGDLEDLAQHVLKADDHCRSWSELTCARWGGASPSGAGSGAASQQAQELAPHSGTGRRRRR